jgi:2-oxoglutarate dehydrogenase E1 component
MHQKFRKPLVIMSPKSLLRHPLATSTMEELAEGSFQPVLGDDLDPKNIQKVVLCSGKLYYELLEERQKRQDSTTALIRLEQLYPLPEARVMEEMAKYSADVKWVWAQEEPANMGAWSYLRTNTDWPLQRVSPAASAAPASGSHQAAHHIQHATIQKTFDC